MVSPNLIMIPWLQTDESTGVVTCREKWELLDRLGDKDQINHTYSSAVFALQYCLPLLVLVITYTFIGLRMWNSKVPGADRSHNQSTRYVVQGRHDSVKKVSAFSLGIFYLERTAI